MAAKGKTSIISVVSLALILAGGISNAAPKVKAGESCKKVGQSRSVGEIVFKCVKKNKKLVWSLTSKGSAAVAPTVSPLPTSSPIPTTSPTPIASPTPTASEVAAPFSIDNLIVAEVYSRSRAEIKKFIDSQNANKVIFNYHIGTNVESARITIAKQEVLDTAKLWSPQLSGKEISIIWYSSKDFDWAANKYREITGFTSQTLNSNACSPDYCGNASATTGAGNKYIFEQGLEFKDAGLMNRSTAAHELTHLAQAALSKNVWNEAPIWSVEGGAQFYGEAIGYTPFDKDLSTRSSMHSQYTYDAKDFLNFLYPGKSMKELLLLNDPAVVKTLMTNLERPVKAPNPGGPAYLLGSYATEVLVALFGHSKMADFYGSFETSKDYRTNFQGVFGITLDSFYTKLTPYLARVALELNR